MTTTVPVSSASPSPGRYSTEMILPEIVFASVVTSKPFSLITSKAAFSMYGAMNVNLSVFASNTSTVPVSAKTVFFLD